MTIENFSAIYTHELSSLYDREEAKSITDFVFIYVLEHNRLNLKVKKNDMISPSDEKLLQSHLVRLIKGEPVQYVLGESWFYGLRFEVNPHVLIPRPETEFLVDMIIKDNRNRPYLHYLDIGTGSGSIAITLKKNFPDSQVEAWDISTDAIKTARKNAELNDCEINFYEFDVLSSASFPGHGPFDVIVSNPPYVTEKEKSGMKSNVLDYEPHQALFVPDDDPLLFYKRIGKIAKSLLKENGKMYFEINASYGRELVIYFQNSGYEKVKLIPDIFGKDRYLVIE